MRTFRTLLAAIAILVVVAAAPASAQAPTTTQQSAMLLDAASSQHSHSSAATITIPAPTGGQFVYIDGVDISNCASASAVTAAAPTYITTTNLPGAPQYQLGSGATAGLCQPVPVGFSGHAVLKATAPNTAVTLVLPAFATNQLASVNVYYHYAF